MLLSLLLNHPLKGVRQLQERLEGVQLERIFGQQYVGNDAFKHQFRRSRNIAKTGAEI